MNIWLVRSAGGCIPVQATCGVNCQGANCIPPRPPDGVAAVHVVYYTFWKKYVYKIWIEHNKIKIIPFALDLVCSQIVAVVVV